MSAGTSPVSKPSELAPGKCLQAWPFNGLTREQAEKQAILELTLQRFAVEVGKSLAEVGKVVERITDAFKQAGLVAGEQPTDPRERALQARRNRGTGPAAPKAWHKR